MSQDCRIFGIQLSSGQKSVKIEPTMLISIAEIVKEAHGSSSIVNRAYISIIRSWFGYSLWMLYRWKNQETIVDYEKLIVLMRGLGRLNLTVAVNMMKITRYKWAVCKVDSVVQFSVKAKFW